MTTATSTDFEQTISSSWPSSLRETCHDLLRALNEEAWERFRELSRKLERQAAGHTDLVDWVKHVRSRAGVTQLGRRLHIVQNELEEAHVLDETELNTLRKLRERFAGEEALASADLESATLTIEAFELLQRELLNSHAQDFASLQQRAKELASDPALSIVHKEALAALSSMTLPGTVAGARAVLAAGERTLAGALAFRKQMPEIHAVQEATPPPAAPPPVTPPPAPEPVQDMKPAEEEEANLSLEEGLGPYTETVSPWKEEDISPEPTAMEDLEEVPSPPSTEPAVPPKPRGSHRGLYAILGAAGALLFIALVVMALFNSPSQPPPAPSPRLEPAPAVPAVPVHEVRKLLGEADRLFRVDRHYQAALVKCEAALRLDPNNQEAIRLRQQIQTTIQLLGKKTP